MLWRELWHGGLKLEQLIQWFQYFSKVLYVGPVVAQEIENLMEVANCLGFGKLYLGQVC